MKNLANQTAFDSLANSYDDEFTKSSIGEAQRDLVWRYLEESGIHNKSRNILEINSGTGYDGTYLSTRGHNVLSTDGSADMIRMAEKHSSLNLQFMECRIQELKSKLPQSNYEVLFSNFGGLNCLSKNELKVFLKESLEYTRNDATLNLVIMSSGCLWEFNYFLLRFRWKKLFRRRKRNGIDFKSDSGVNKIYYYSPRTIKNLAADYEMVVKRPVGFMIPPSYMQNYFSRRPKFLQKLINIDKRLTNMSWLSNLADHYYIELKRK